MTPSPIPSRTSSRRLRRFSLAATVVAAGSGTGTGLAVVPAAGADSVLRLTALATHNTDLDLGAPGPSIGDQQVFRDDVQRDGRTVGSSAGACTITLLTEDRLAVACSAVMTLPEGAITVQWAFDQDLTAAPESFTAAVTGGTGRYRGAAGEVTGTFRAETDPQTGADVIDLVVHLR